MLKRSFALGAVVAAAAGALITGAPAAYAGDYIINSGTGDVVNDTVYDNDTANAICGNAAGMAGGECEEAAAAVDQSETDDSGNDNSAHDHSDHSDNSDNSEDNNNDS